MRVSVLKLLHHAGERNLFLVVEHRTRMVSPERHGRGERERGGEHLQEGSSHFFSASCAFLTASSLITAASSGTKSKCRNWLVPDSVVRIMVFLFSELF